MKLAVISSHPIQYNAPLFSQLAQTNGLDIKVFFGWKGTAHQADPEFGTHISWDIPLLEGYDYCFVDNVSRDPGTHHFKGLDCPSMVKTIEAWSPDAILVYGWAFKAHLAVLRHFYGRIPVFFRGDSTLISGGAAWRRVPRNLWLRWVYRHVDHALYVGSRNAEYFRSCGLVDRQLHWVPHSIDNHRFAQFSTVLEERALQERFALGIPDDALVVLFAGKLVERKMPGTLIDAVIALKREESEIPIHLVMVGEGPLKQSLVSDSSPFSFIHFLGFRNQSEMPLVYRLGDVFVLPSSTETWGLAVNEAFACSRPAIVSDRVGCAPDLIIDGETGFAFRCGDSAGLSEILRRFVAQRDRCLEMGENAARLIEDWSTKQAAQTMAAVVTEKTREYKLSNA